MFAFELATSSEISRTLCDRLRAQRLAQNLQQGELAARAGVSVGTVRNLENKAQSTLDSFVKIVMALGQAGELKDLFQPTITSLQQLEALSQPRRRAGRRGQ